MTLIFSATNNNRSSGRSKKGLVFLPPFLRRQKVGGAYMSNHVGPLALQRSSSVTSSSEEDIPIERAIWKSQESRIYINDKHRMSRDETYTWAEVEDSRIPMRNRFQNNHLAINKTRAEHSVPTLKRSKSLDNMARRHAQAMAAAECVQHSCPADIQCHLCHDDTRRLGENIGRGETTWAIQKEMMSNPSDANNILDARYTEMGVGTAKGADGSIYLCQLFRG